MFCIPNVLTNELLGYNFNLDISTIQSEELHDNLNAEKELEDKNEVNVCLI